MTRMLCASITLLLIGAVSPAGAGEGAQSEPLCYWCIRDAIYADLSLIDRLEANPDVDDGLKGPQIAAARADIHRLRKLLGPPVQESATPCCYAREPLHVR